MNIFPRHLNIFLHDSFNVCNPIIGNAIICLTNFHVANIWGHLQFFTVEKQQSHSYTFIHAHNYLFRV